MAKLSELKALLAKRATRRRPKRRAQAPRAAPPAPAPPKADADVDLREVFADVAPLRAANRAARPRPASAGLARAAPGRRGRGARREQARRRAFASRIGTSDRKSKPSRRSCARASAATCSPGCAAGTGRCRASSTCTGSIATKRATRSPTSSTPRATLGWRCVRVIHGKGLSSPNREPVLKGKVRRWLAQRDEVLAYCEAPQHAGGAGAVLVLLKASRA